MNEELFTPDEIEFYILAVYHGLITTHNLSGIYHSRVGTHLYDAVETGYKSTMGQLNFPSPQYETLKGLRSNIYVFSAAKQYQQVRTMSKLINENGEKRTYTEFKLKANEVFDEYNKNYLKAEFNTAIGQSQAARDWVEAVQKKDIFPLLRYETQRDNRVRDSHKALDGITLPVDHPFWNNNAPKNGWNCRCFFTSHDASVEQTNLKERNLTDLQDEEKFPDLFKMNPGKDKIVFDPKTHPYFRVAKGDLNWKNENFGQPIP